MLQLLLMFLVLKYRAEYDTILKLFYNTVMNLFALSLFFFGMK